MAQKVGTSHIAGQPPHFSVHSFQFTLSVYSFDMADGFSTPNAKGKASAAASAEQIFGTHRLCTVPTPKKTNNEVVDSQNQSLAVVLQQIIDGCQDDPKLLVLPLHTRMSELIEAKKRLVTGYDASKCFAKSPLCLANVEPKFKIEFVLWVSDIDSITLAKVIDEDPDALDQLITFHTNLDAHTRLIKECVFIGFLWEFLVLLGQNNGTPLQRFKANGSIDNHSFVLRWAEKGVYKFHFEAMAEHPSACTFRDRFSLLMGDSRVVTNRHRMAGNFSVYKASLVLEPFLEIPLVRVFQSLNAAAGPDLTSPLWDTKKGKFVKFMNGLYAPWKLKMSQNPAGSERREQAVKIVEDKHEVKRKGISDEATTAAAKALAVKKAKRTGPLG